MQDQDTFITNNNRQEIFNISFNTSTQFDVFMESGNGKLLQFAWIVEKVTEGQYKDCWMTVAVSAPRSAGQGS